MANWELIDKALIFWEDMTLTETWDFQVVTGNETTLQAAQNRIVSYLQTWKFDDNFWNNLPNAMRNMSPYKITDNMVFWYVEYALQSMILDWRVKNINSVTIIDRTNDDITIEIILTLWTFVGSIVVVLPIFIS